MGEPTTFTGEVIVWTVIDAALLMTTLAGNVLTLCAIRLSKKLSGVLSNRFVFSLALSDLMVGLTIPYHSAFMVGNWLSGNRETCILKFVLVIFACSSSIYNILIIATDRYVAVVHPLLYNRYMTKRIAIAVIAFGWCAALSYATLLLFWNDWEEGEECSLNLVVPAEYATYILTPLFISVWLFMLLIYIKISRVANKHAKRLRDVAKCQHGNVFPNDWKSVKVVMLILSCFSICWLPYFVTVTYIQILGKMPMLVYEISFTLAMANSSMNPLIYAWKNSNFRMAFWCMLRCRSPNSATVVPDYVTNHEPTTVGVCLERARCGSIGEDAAACSQLTVRTDCERGERKGSDCNVSDTTVSTY